MKMYKQSISSPSQDDEIHRTTVYSVVFLHCYLITGKNYLRAQPKADTGHKMQSVSVVFFNVTLLGIYC